MIVAWTSVKVKVLDIGLSLTCACFWACHNQSVHGLLCQGGTSPTFQDYNLYLQTTTILNPTFRTCTCRNTNRYAQWSDM